MKKRISKSDLILFIAVFCLMFGLAHPPAVMTSEYPSLKEYLKAIDSPIVLQAFVTGIGTGLLLAYFLLARKRGGNKNGEA